MKLLRHSKLNEFWLQFNVSALSSAPIYLNNTLFCTGKHKFINTIYCFSSDMFA